MIGKTEKIILGILVVFLIGMSGVLITALSTNDQVKENRDSKIFESSQQRTIQLANSAQEREIDDEDEKEDMPITGNALDKASAVALKYIGEGQVTDTEVDEEEGYYEIEITLDNGQEVDVHLDQNFKVLGKEIEYSEEDEDD